MTVVDQVGLTSLADPQAQVVARDDLESVLSRAVSDTMQLFLAELTADVTRRIRKNPGQPWEYVTVSLAAASSPLDPLALGDLNRRWEWLVDAGIVETLRQQWAEANVPIGQAGWSSARATGHLLSYVRDRLVYGDHISPTVPEDAFDTIRARLSEAQQQQWSADQTSAAVANDLGWFIDRDALEQRKTDAENKIAAILDWFGPPGTPLREEQRRTNSEIQRLQKLRTEAVLDLRREQSHWKTRADRIARTESTVASGYATLQALHDEGWTHKQWIATLDNRTRDEHKIVDRDVQELDEPFQITSRGRAYSVQFPGDPAAPAELVVNCVIGSTEVTWPGQEWEYASERQFTGDFIEIVTRRGHRLTCTPNHPILTTFGFLPAQVLRQGDHVISAGVTEPPEVDDVPPRIEELLGPPDQRRAAAWVCGRTVNFHGDGTDSEVQVVSAYWSLLEDLRAASTKDVSKTGFVHLDGSPPLFTPAREVPCAPLVVRGRLREAEWLPTGGVSGCREFTPFLKAESAHADTIGLRAAAHGQSHLLEAQDDDVATAAEVFAHLEHAASLGMEPDEIVEINVAPDTQLVYNLQTTRGWYIGNGIAQHNCRCVLVGADRGDSRLIYSPEYAPISAALADQAKQYAADYAQWGPEFEKVKAELSRIEDRIREVFVDNPDLSDDDIAEFERLDDRRRELETATEWMTDFISEAVDIWNAYQYAGDYRRINQVLRDALHPEREELANQWGWIVDHLGITTDREHVLYRGILSAGEDWADKFPDGSIFTDHGVISTTPRLNFARSWISNPSGDVGPVVDGSVLLEILVPAGARVVGANSNLEIMLAPGSQFKVLNTIRQKVAHYPGETTIVRMMLL